jgi:hypothetical protein
MSPKWAALSCLAPALLLWRDRPFPFTRAHLFGGILILWAALSVAWSEAPLYSLNGLWQTVTLPAVCFCLGSQTPQLRPLFIGAGLGMVVSSAVSVGQLAGWVDWQTINIPSGLFLNKNFMAEAAALVLIWLVAERVWWLVLLVIPAIALTDARGALLALGMGLLLLFLRRPSLPVGGLLAGTVGLFVHAMLTHGPATMAERVDIWGDAADGITVIGNGIGSFGAGAHKLQPDGIPLHAHNEALELVWDLGLVGLGLAVLFVRELFGPLNSTRLVLVAAAVEACFAFPLHLPVTLALAAVAAGHAVRDRAVVRDGTYRRRNFGNPGLAGAGP